MEQLAAGGLPLGIMPNADFREGRTQLHPGDVLVIYSDGVSGHATPPVKSLALRGFTKWSRGTWTLPPAAFGIESNQR